MKEMENIEMSKDIIVIYNSQTGFTKKYAQWISEALECECVELNVAGKLNFEQYDAIIFGSWACAGGISKIKWFKNNLKKWNDKKLAVYCVGGSPIENPEIEVAMKNWFTEEEHQKVKIFYCPGGFNYERMSGTSKLMMKMFISVLKAKKDKTEVEKIQAEMISKSYDISDEKYIEPIVDWAKHIYD